MKIFDDLPTICQIYKKLAGCMHESGLSRGSASNAKV